MSHTFITVNDFEDTKEWKKFIKGLCEKSKCNKYKGEYAVKLNNKLHLKLSLLERILLELLLYQ